MKQINIKESSINDALSSAARGGVACGFFFAAATGHGLYNHAKKNDLCQNVSMDDVPGIMLSTGILTGAVYGLMIFISLRGHIDTNAKFLAMQVALVIIPLAIGNHLWGTSEIEQCIKNNAANECSNMMR